MNITLAQHVRNMLLLGKKIVTTNPTLTEELGTTNIKGDKTIQMDVAIEKAFVAYIQDKNIPADIYSEEIGKINFKGKAQYLIAFDPLDGSTNYKIGKNIFPYGTLIAVYNNTSPKLKDVVVSGAIEYSRDLAWIYEDGNTKDLNGRNVVLKEDWNLDKHTPIYLDLYYRDGYIAYTPLAQKLFIRNAGSTIGNLSYVLENIAAGLGGVCMRPEEIGAIVSLISGAGGLVINHNGVDVREENFSSNDTYQIIAGSSPAVNFAVSTLRS